MKARFLLIGVALCTLWLAACSGNAPSANTNSRVPKATDTPALNESPTSAAIPTMAPVTAPAAVATTAAPTTGSAPAAGAPPSGNPGDVVLKAENLRLTKPTRMKDTRTNSADNTSSVTTIEFQPPDRIHMVEPNGTEMILIKGQGSWIKQNGKWAKSPVDMSEAIFGMYNTDTIQQIEKAMNVTPAKFVGPDLLDGQPMWVYTYTTTIPGAAAGGKDLTSQSKIWIGAIDGLPHRVESDTPSVTKAGVTDHSVITYEYPPSIDIQPPA